MHKVNNYENKYYSKYDFIIVHERFFFFLALPYTCFSLNNLFWKENGKKCAIFKPFLATHL